MKAMGSETYQLVAQMICLHFPETPVHCRHQAATMSNSLPLSYEATFFDYVILNGKRYYASHAVRGNWSSFVHVVIPGESATHAFREILKIFQIYQLLRAGMNHMLWFACLWWFKSWEGDLDDVWANLWVEFYMLSLYSVSNIKHSSRRVGVQLWQLEEFHMNKSWLHSLINLDWIHSAFAMMMVSLESNREKVWAT